MNLKRNLPALFLGLFLCAFFAIFVVRIVFARPSSGWIPLKDGGAIRLETITMGTTHRLRLPGPSFSERLNASLRRLSFAPFTERDEATAPGWGGPGLCAWIVMQDAGGRSMKAAELILPDGQRFISEDSGSHSRAPMTYCYQIFNVLPYTAPKVRIAVYVGDERFEWERDNPAYQHSLTEWTPEPLPQTRMVGPYQVTLKEIAKTSQDRGWGIIPKAEVTEPGKNKSVRGIDISFRVQDAGGNEFHDTGLFSAKAWKLIPTLRRTSDFPFAKDEVQWIDGLSEEDFQIEAGHYRLFNVSDGAKAKSVMMAGVFGPGQYELRDGKVINDGLLVGPPRDDVTWKFREKLYQMAFTEPRLVIVLDGSSPLLVFFRDFANRPVSLQSSLSHRRNDSWVQTYELRKDKAVSRFGVASPIVPEAERNPVAFVVAPPKPPGN